jgi:hypothetical protein
MEYKLAKQLKDARFPYKPKQLHHDGNIETPPSLSELIEACNLDWIQLQKGAVFKFRGKSLPLYCSAKGQGNALDDEIKEEWGSTLEEAVAKLWLALHE